VRKISLVATGINNTGSRLRKVVTGLEITDVRLRKVETETKMKAIASFTIDNEFVVHDVRVVEGQNGLFVAMPSRKMPNGEFKDIAHPITPETREKIQNAIINAYNQQTEQSEEAELT